VDSYNDIPAIRNSDLNDFYKSPALYKYRKDHPDTERHDYYDIGTMYHKVILEPETIQRDILLYDMQDRPQPTMTMAGKENKAWMAQLVETAEKKKKQLISMEHYNQAQAMAESTYDDPVAKELLAVESEHEVTRLWKHNDMDCKCKIDILNPFFNADLKSAADAEPYSWQRKAYSTFRYHRQAGMYSDGDAGGLFTGEKEFFFIVCEKEPPYQVAVHQVTFELLMDGIAEYQRLTSEIKACIKSDKWPGYSYHTFDGKFTWDLPKWAQ